MRKIFFFIALLSFLIHTNKLFAQVTLGIGNAQLCNNAYSSIPITVQNLIDVDSLRIEFSLNSNVAEYNSYFALHSQLSGGVFSINSFSDKVIVVWHKSTSANIINDTLVMLSLLGKEGTTPLVWNQVNCIFHTSSGSYLSGNYINGMLSVNPKMSLLLTEINQTCASKCDANFMATVSGGVRPISYLWNAVPGRFDSIQTSLCSGLNTINLKDANGCEVDSLFTIVGLPGADVTLKIECDGDTTTKIYIQNPTLSFSLSENYPTHVIEPPVWEFGDGDTARSFNPTHTYDEAITNLDGFYILKIHVKNENECDTTIVQKITIHQTKLKIPNVIVKNSDKEFNQIFIISDAKSDAVEIEETFIKNQYKRVELLVIDRWGRKIYSDSDYKNDWRAENVPDGVYFYTLNTIGFYTEEYYRGSITIFGSGVTK